MDFDGMEGDRREGQDGIVELNVPERRFRHFSYLSNMRVTDRPQDYVAEAYRRRTERVVVCVDGSNLFYAASKLKLEVDYTKLLRQAVAGRFLFRAYFYTGVDPKNDKQQGFLLWMRRHGFRVVTRNLMSLANGERTANLDVEIAVDMVQLADHCDTVVLFSGDGDLSYAVERASQKGARIEVVGLRSMTSESLLNIADHYVDLADLTPQIQKAPKYRAPKLEEDARFIA